MNNIEIANVVVDIAFGVTYVGNAVLPCAMRYFRKLKSADPQHAPLLLRTSSHHEGNNVACLRTITHEHQPFSSWRLWTDRRCQGGAIHQGGSLIRTVKRDHARSCEVPSAYRQGERVAADCRALQRKRPDPRPGSYLGVRVHWSSGR